MTDATDLLHFTCQACGAAYAVPGAYRSHIEGRALGCKGCGRWWVALPASSGPPVRLAEGKVERSQIDLGRYHSKIPPMPAAPDLAAPSGGGAAPATQTTRIAVQPDAGAVRSLRIAVSGPDTRVRGVFDLAGKSFLIGRERCHLNLARLAIPPRAIRVIEHEGGFRFEGIDGFAIPLGSLSVLSGQVDPISGVRFKLRPYEIVLEISTTPGSSIPDLEKGAPRPVVKPSLRPSEIPKMGGMVPGTDIRSQMQELAVEVRPDQGSFGGAPQPNLEEFDGDQTMTSLGASGFQAMRFGNPMQGLDLRLVRADGPDKGKEFRITKTPLLIGRTDGDLVLRHGQVSSKHAQLDVTGPRIYTLKDLASTNGTTVNDRPISIAHLKSGDVISFGGISFEFRAEQLKQ